MFCICAENGVDNTEVCSLLLSRVYTASGAVPLLTLLHQRAGWECTRSWGGTQAGQLTPTGQRDTPYRVTSCSACKAGGRRRKGGCLELWHLSSQVAVTGDGAQLSWGWPNTCLRWELVNEFLGLLCLRVWLLLHLLSCLYIRPRVFSLLLFQFSLPSWCRESERAAVWGWAASRG